MFKFEYFIFELERTIMNLADITTFSRRAELAYDRICAPLCKELGFPQAALDILLFLYNNPELNTASSIATYRNIKPNLISNYVEKLVNAKYLTRCFSGKDRRIVELVLTEKGLSVGKEGKKLQEKYFEVLTEGLSKNELQIFSDTLNSVNDNLSGYLKK